MALFHPFLRLRPLLRYVETRTLLSVVLVAGALWGFGSLAEEVMEGDTRAADVALLLALRTPGNVNDPIGPPSLEIAMRDITALGSPTVLALMTVAVMGAFVIRGQRRSAVFLGVAVTGGHYMSLAVKNLFDRPRPDLVPHLTEILSPSFPSGHSMMAAVTWLTLAVMLARTEPQRRMKVYYIAVAALVAVLVGISRVYLGVHWPSDVLAGWALGAAWAFLCLLVAHWLERRGQIEPERGEPVAPGRSEPSA